MSQTVTIVTGLFFAAEQEVVQARIQEAGNKWPEAAHKGDASAARRTPDKNKFGH